MIPSLKGGLWARRIDLIFLCCTFSSEFEDRSVVAVCMGTLQHNDLFVGPCYLLTKVIGLQLFPPLLTMLVWKSLVFSKVALVGIAKIVKEGDTLGTTGWERRPPFDAACASVQS